ncbi:alkaline phosphatase D family protein [Planctomycetes bacterium K23_9]|uniref:Alkaline phosphatase D n=1 Tax=Stieleria marina TaxID=1930275 RepID=A0A517NXE6_9BACT|nr:Alkaline phosphatase D precursor [Planctomycetes bacterium K23_9]
MQYKTIKLWAVLAVALCHTSQVAGEEQQGKQRPISRVVFGSCIKQDQPTPIFFTMHAARPDLLLFTGDNIYADTNDMSVLRTKYEKLAANPDFRRLRQSCPVRATWDDHDFGINDGGADFAERSDSQKEFVRFWDLPAQSPIRQRPGVYDVSVFGPAGKRTQVIMLDTRYFRSKLKAGKPRVGGRYVPDDDDRKTMLGADQWKWLAEQLRQPAEVRLIVSSIQFAASSAGQECWANLPGERQRLIDLIRSTEAKGVVLMSGDRHWSEFSAITQDVPYPIYDVTCSSLNQLHKRGTPTENAFRVSETTYHRENFGVLTIAWDESDPAIQISIRDIEGTPRIEKDLRLSELQ